MSSDVGTLVSGSQIRLGVGPSLRGSIARLANGRVLVIDYFASRRCNVVIGDLTAEFVDAPPRREHIEVEPLEGIRVFAATRLRVFSPI